MNLKADPNYDARIKALAERSSYIENVLRHALLTELSSIVWSHDPNAALQIFNAEVDSAGFDVVLSLGSQARYVQLKQAHDQKVPSHYSVRLSFSSIPGSCIVLISHSISELRLTHFRFFGGGPKEPMDNIAKFSLTKVPARKGKLRTNYRDVPGSHFKGPYSAAELLDVLFPSWKRNRGIISVKADVI